MPRRTTSLSPEEAIRAQTWNLEIAGTLLGTDTPWHDEGHDRRWQRSGGFSVDRRTGAWFCFAAAQGGHNPVGMLRFLRPEYSHDDAALWLGSFLTEHPGTGPCNTEVAEDDDTGEARRHVNAAEARRILDTMVPVDGTPGEHYLRSRGLLPPYSKELLGYVDDARTGEGALAAILRADGRVTGVQVLYLAAGAKSLARPLRARFNLEPARHAVFDIQVADAAKDMQFDVVVCEGLEDGLSLSRLGRHWQLIAVPGVGALQHIRVRPNDRVLVFRDGDAPGSVPDKALLTGVDHLISAGALVKITDTPAGQDVNSLLAAHPNLAALRKLIAGAKEASLSDIGEFERLAHLDPVELDRQAQTTAKRMGISVGTLRKEVAKRRPKRLVEAGDTVPGPADIAVDPVWEGAVDLDATLTASVAEMKRYLAAPDFYFDIIAVWAAVTYLVQDEKFEIPVVPQLALQSIGSSAGKSTGLELVATQCCRGQLRSSYTPSTVFRSINAKQVTFALVDLHNKLGPGETELRQVIQACHRRAEAIVDRTVILASGEPEVRSYLCWAALAWGSIGPMPQEVQNRAIVLPMRRALPEEGAKLLKSSPSKSPALVDIRRQLAAWAGRLQALPLAALPESLSNRDADNWRPLLRVAQVSGGEWPERMRAAVAALAKVETRKPLLLRLLADIQGIFDDPELASPLMRITSSALIGKLLSDADSGWAEANHGRAITSAWLRERFEGLLEPPGAQQWQEAGQHGRGYTREQFQDAWLRYLPTPAPAMPDSPGTSGTSGTEHVETADLKGNGAVPDEPHAVPGRLVPEIHPVLEGSRETGASAAIIPDVPLVPDENQKAGVGGGKGTPRGAGRAAPTVRRTRSKRPNGKDVGAGLHPAKPPPGSQGDITAAIRQLALDYPSRSRTWIAKRVGQPKSVIAAVLGDGEAL